MPPHPDLAILQTLFPYIREYQQLALAHGINDIFQDNGGKLLQVILMLGLHVTGSREGNDAVDDLGNEYELKSVNTLLSRSFTTHHHLNAEILAKYRQVSWYFAVYEGIELTSIYLLSPDQLEPFYSKWEQKYHLTGIPLNNPKIPLAFVKKWGTLVYHADE
jgi:hypothetical protein